MLAGKRINTEKREKKLRLVLFRLTLKDSKILAKEGDKAKGSGAAKRLSSQLNLKIRISR